MSPGLRRARAPFFLRNAVTGVVLASFAVGVWAYSIGAVKQDDFTDVDEEARSLARAGAQVGEKKTASSAVGSSGAALLPSPDPAASVIAPRADAAAAPPPQKGPEARGFAALVDLRKPHLLDEQTKTFVWGAPPVENMGRMGDRVEWPCRYT